MGYLPRAKYLKDGDTVWMRDVMPMRQAKVLGIVRAHDPPYKDFVWLEDKDTKERFCVLTDWVSDLDPTKQWSDTEREPEETSFHSKDNLDKKEMKLKDKETLSSEVAEGKLPHQILASRLEILSTPKDSEIRFAVTEKLSYDTAVDDSVIDGFIQDANTGKSPDGTYWVYDKNRTISFKLNSLGDTENLNYYIKSKKVRPAEFFRLVESNTKMVIRAYRNNQYLLNLGGTEMLLTEDDLGLMCADWKLNYSQVKSSLRRWGKWSL